MSEDVGADAESLVRTYYRALDEHEYETLESVLAPSFVQHRPDRTFDDRASFVRFMREDRPEPNTRHELDECIVDGERAAVQGRLVRTDGRRLLAFTDFFIVEDGAISRLETYTR